MLSSVRARALGALMACALFALAALTAGQPALAGGGQVQDDRYDHHDGESPVNRQYGGKHRCHHRGEAV